ncbi:MAG: DUF3568 family protein [Phycisphaeraceae bacterium]|nr:DUF3568 family protein [Phycisphaeraceae bacterium]
MPVGRVSRWRIAAGLSAWIALTLVFAAILMAGCKARVEQAGTRRDVAAAYRIRTLSADVPGDISVHAAAAAAHSALRGRGYVITRSEVNADAARIEARAHGDGALDKTVVQARPASDGAVRITVTAEPLGDERASRAILDAMLARLGR